VPRPSIQTKLRLTLVLLAGTLGVSCSVGHSEPAPVAPALVSRAPARPAPSTPAPVSAAPSRPDPPAPALEHAERVLRERARGLSSRERQGVARELRRAQSEHGLDTLLLLALIDQESRFDARARGPKGSLGLMQVRPFVGKDVARRLGIPWKGANTLFDPVLNVRIGSAYLAEVKRMYDQNHLALAAYNMGPYRVKRLIASGQPPRSRYAALVLEGYAALQRRFHPALGPPAL